MYIRAIVLLFQIYLTNSVFLFDDPGVFKPPADVGPFPTTDLHNICQTLL